MERLDVFVRALEIGVPQVGIAARGLGLFVRRLGRGVGWLETSAIGVGISVRALETVGWLGAVGRARG